MKANKPVTGAQKAIGDVAPKLAELTDVAFYVGWPNAMSAMPKVPDLLETKP